MPLRVISILFAGLFACAVFGGDDKLSKIQRENKAENGTFCEFIADPAGVIKEAKALERTGKPMQAHEKLQDIAFQYLRNESRLDPTLSQELDQWRLRNQGQWVSQGELPGPVTVISSGGEPIGPVMVTRLSTLDEDGQAQHIEHLVDSRTLEAKSSHPITRWGRRGTAYVVALEDGSTGRVFSHEGQELMDVPNFVSRFRGEEIYWLPRHQLLFYIGNDDRLHWMDRAGIDHTERLGELSQIRVNRGSSFIVSPDMSQVTFQSDNPYRFEVRSLSDFKKKFEVPTQIEGFTTGHLEPYPGGHFFQLSGEKASFLLDSQGQVLDQNRDPSSFYFMVSRRGTRTIVFSKSKGVQPYLWTPDGRKIPVHSRLFESPLAQPHPPWVWWTVGDRYMILHQSGMDRLDIIDTQTGQSTLENGPMKNVWSYTPAPDESYLALSNQSGRVALVTHQGVRVGEFNLPPGWDVPFTRIEFQGSANRILATFSTIGHDRRWGAHQHTREFRLTLD